MSPRKKSKPNSEAPADGSGLDTSTPASSSETISDVTTLTKKPSRKWLGGTGSWRSKAPAVVKTAKESIGVGVAGGAAAEIPDKDATANQQAPTKFLTKRKSSKGNAIPASTTKFHVSSDGSIDDTQRSRPGPSREPSDAPPPNIDEPPLPPEPEPVKKDPSSESAGTFGWRSWWSRPDGYSDAARTKDADEAQRTPLPGLTPLEEPNSTAKVLETKKSYGQDVEMKDAPPTDTTHSEEVEMKEAPPPVDGAKNASSTSWFWIWSTTQNAQAKPPTETPVTTENGAPKTHAPAEATPEPQLAAPSEPAVQVPPANDTAQSDPKEAPTPSGWAFWFRDKPKTEGKLAEGTSHKQVGEVAVFNTPSQSHPEAAQFNEEERPKNVPTKEPPKQVVEESVAKRSFRSLRGRPKGKDTTKETPTDTPASSKAATPSKSSPTHSPARTDITTATQQAPKPQPTAKKESPNTILPQFKSTYQLVQQPSFWQQIRQYFLGGEPAMPHLHINPAPPRIRKAVAIGVHGFYPAAILQRVLGQPTGTSIRFATAAREAIEGWTRARGYSVNIEQIALEGEGSIAERVNTLWKLLLNWIEHIKAADFILVACHSQGVPVAMMLVAKLIQFGCVSAARIGVCAMAGINMGPFIEYKTKYFGPTAAELFEFSDPKSLVSQMYLAALDEVLCYGVRILYVGSIDDQLVSLESSTFSTLSHPYIYRAVFVDGRIHAPDFLTHLVGFSLKMRNLGLPDHGLIRELSPALAGSLYGGEGHSRLYDDPYVYELAVQHALETTSVPIRPEQQRPPTSASFRGINIPIPGAKVDEKDAYALRVKEYEGVGGGNQNPYFLPWAMRGLLEEEFVKKELGQEVKDLLAMFEDWKPTGKQLKDVKFRLEGVRSRL